MLKLNFKFKTRNQKLTEFVNNVVAQEDPKALQAVLITNRAYAEGYNKGVSRGAWATAGLIGIMSSLCVMYYQLGKDEADAKHTAFLADANARLKRILDDMKSKQSIFTPEEKENLKKANTVRKKTTTNSAEKKEEKKDEEV